MILPVNLNTNSNNKVYTNIQKNNNSTTKHLNELQLSGYNNPMKSYAVSFGWCTSHYQAMYEIDEKYTQKLKDKLQEIENLKKQGKNNKKRYSIVDNAALEAAKIIAQYANMQCVVAEVPPSYAIMNGGKLRQAIQESETLTNPVSSLVAINSLINMDVKNKDLDENHLERAKGATQLYAIGIMLEQVEENKNRPEFIQNIDYINELTQIVKQSLCQIYGDDVFERMQEFGAMGKNPTTEQKAKALDFLVEVDSMAKSVKLPNNFQEKLQILLDRQSADEGRILDADETTVNKFTIKVQYPDHDHSLAHAHGIPHEHKHEHNHEHADDAKYKEILDNMHSKKEVENTQVQVEEKKRKNYL